MHISDYTKGHPARLGQGGAARPGMLHQKIHQVDCTPVVTGAVEHSYYMDGWVNDDIALSIHGRPQEDDARPRERDSALRNVWSIVKQA